MHYCMACLKGCCIVYNPSRTPPRDLWLVPVRQRVQFKVAVLVFQCLSGNAPTYLADDCQLIADISMRQLHSTNTAMWCVLFDGHTTPSAIGVSQRLDHACGTHYLLNYNNVRVSENSNACWRHTCSGTTALCDILVKSAVLKSSYLLTYLLTYGWFSKEWFGRCPSHNANQFVWSEGRQPFAAVVAVKIYKQLAAAYNEMSTNGNGPISCQKDVVLLVRH